MDEITREKLLDTLWDIIDACARTGNMSDAVKAIDLIVRLHGIATEESTPNG